MLLNVLLTLEMTVLMLVITVLIVATCVLIRDEITGHTAFTTVPIAFMTVDITLLITFHAVTTKGWTIDITVVMILWMSGHTSWMSCCIAGIT